MYENSKFLIKRGIIVAIVLALVATPILVLGSVNAQGQDTCPSTGDWVKVDGLTGKNYTYTAPEGYLIIQTCYKAATYVIFNDIIPPQKSVTITSTVGHDLSHASFKLIKAATPTSTPTDQPPTPTPTDQPPTPTPTDQPPTPTPTDQPPTPTPTDQPPTPTPTDQPPTPTPTDQPPTPTPTDQPPTPTPTDQPPTPTPTEEDWFNLRLAGVCSGSNPSNPNNQTINWKIVNDNDQPVSFIWTANNGQSGQGIVPANGNVNFVTSIDGTNVSIEYTLSDQPKKVQASLDPCPTKETTPEPTVVATSEPTITLDPEPDQPAGGSGPSFISSLSPVMIGLFTMAIIPAALRFIKRE